MHYYKSNDRPFLVVTRLPSRHFIIYHRFSDVYHLSHSGDLSEATYLR